MNLNNRNYGLDVLRTIAILSVLIAHLIPTINLRYNNFVVIFATLGVEIFFVLSGFLIGNIIIKDFYNSHNYNVGNLKHFWKRRWFRTLPNYYLILVISIIFYFFVIEPINIQGLWKLKDFIFFFQNFATTQPRFFEVSWSLAIEEWFYLLFPIFLYIISRFTVKKDKAILLTIFLFIFLGNILRFYYVSFPFRPEDWDAIFRKIVILRIDAIAYGVLAAFLFRNKRRLWDKHKIKSFFIGLTIVLILMVFLLSFYIGGGKDNIFMRTLFFTLLSISIMLTIPLVFTLKKGTFYNFNSLISVTSYSIYLNHTIIIALALLLFKTQTLQEEVIRAILLFIVIIFISLIQYKYYEKPFTDLR